MYLYLHFLKIDALRTGTRTHTEYRTCTYAS